MIVEDERSADGSIVRAATMFLTGRECPWRCVMCDLWQFTTADDTPKGAIPHQIAAARRSLEASGERIDQVKLYNAGSFFDARAVPDDDYDAVATELGALTRVIVESHPALVGSRVDRLLEAFERANERTTAPRLEVAMGLETAHPDALHRLHKGMTVDLFARAAGRLRQRAVVVRAFLLISPPFIPREQQDDWLLKSIDMAWAVGASVVSLIPTRPGNGALEALVREGSFHAPHLEDIERSAALAHARNHARGRIFVDVWDLDRFADCPDCLPARRDRLHQMNLRQTVLPRLSCAQCACAPTE